jgi:hypothetical protein
MCVAQHEILAARFDVANAAERFEQPAGQAYRAGRASFRHTRPQVEFVARRRKLFVGRACRVAASERACDATLIEDQVGRVAGLALEIQKLLPAAESAHGHAAIFDPVRRHGCHRDDVAAGVVLQDQAGSGLTCLCGAIQNEVESVEARTRRNAFRLGILHRLERPADDGFSFIQAAHAPFFEARGYDIDLVAFNADQEIGKVRPGGPPEPVRQLRKGAFAGRGRQCAERRCHCQSERAFIPHSRTP